MGIVLTLFSFLYNFLSVTGFLILFGILISHIVSRVKRAPPLKLTADSVVVILGGCMGIGKLMAIDIARQFHCTIIIVDVKKELFE